MFLVTKARSHHEDDLLDRPGLQLARGAASHVLVADAAYAAKNGTGTEYANGCNVKFTGIAGTIYLPGTVNLIKSARLGTRSVKGAANSVCSCTMWRSPSAGH